MSGERSSYGRPISKTFTNHLDFERGLWQRKMGLGGRTPKTSVFGVALMSARSLRHPQDVRVTPDKNPSGGDPKYRNLRGFCRGCLLCPQRFDCVRRCLLQLELFFLFLIFLKDDLDREFQKLFTEAILKFFRKIIPEQWHNFRNPVTDNFRIISDQNLQVLV
jgi:hypothetical protein